MMDCGICKGQTTIGCKNCQPYPNLNNFIPPSNFPSNFPSNISIPYKLEMALDKFWQRYYYSKEEWDDVYSELFEAIAEYKDLNKKSK